MNPVTWPQLLEWAKAHGAINDRILDMSIGTRHIDGEIQGTVTITGHAEDEHGLPYQIRPGNSLAMWSITEILLSLPGESIRPEWGPDHPSYDEMGQ